MAKLESLIIDMQLQTAELTKGLDEVKKQLKETSKHAEGLLNFEVLKEVGHMAVEAAEKLADFALKGAEVADQMGKMATSAGVPIETFSRLAYAAKLSHISADDLGVAFKKLNVNIAEAAAGSAKQSSLFNALGVSVKDAAGKTKTADVVMGELAERFSQMQEGPAKAALAVELFGKAGAGMLPFLNDGKEGLAKLSAEADRLGVTISGPTAKAATEFNDNLERLQAVVQGVSVQVAAELAPAMAELTAQLLHSKTAADGFKGAGQDIANVLRVIADVAVEVFGQIRKLGTGLGAFFSIAANLATGSLAGAMEVSKEYQEQVEAINRQTADQVEAIWKKAEKVMTLPELDFSKKLNPSDILRIANAGVKATTEQEQAIKNLTKTTDEYLTKLEGFGKGPFEQLMANFDKGPLSEELKKAGAAGSVLRDIIVETDKALIEAQNDAAKIKLDFGVQRQVSQNNAAFAQQKAAYDAIGHIGSLAEAAMRPFASFDEALAAAALHTNNQAKYLADANEYVRQGGEANERAAEKMLKLADQEGLLAAEAGRGTAALADLARTTAQLQTSFGGVIGLKLGQAFGATTAEQFGAAGAIGNNIAGATGKAGSVINSAMEGAQAGGIWGALIAAVADIVKDSVGFQKIIKQMDADLKELGDSIGSMFDPLGELVEAIKPLTSAIAGVIKGFVGVMNQLHGAGQVGDVIKPIVELLQKILGPIMKIIGSLGQMVSSLGIFDAIISVITPIFDLLGKVVGDVLGPVVTMLGRVFKDVGDVLRPIITIISSIGTLIGTLLAPLGALFDLFGVIIGVIDKISNALGGFSLGIKIISTVLNVVALIMLEISNGLTVFWSGIAKAFHDVFADLAHAFGDNADLNKVAVWFSQQQFGAEATAKEIQKKVDDTIQAIADTWVPNFKDPFADAGNGRSLNHHIENLGQHFERLQQTTEKTATAMAKLTEQFTNLPAGFKVRLRALQATDATGGPLEPAQQGDIHIHAPGGLFTTIDQLVQMVHQAQRRQTYRTKGF